MDKQHTDGISFSPYRTHKYSSTPTYISCLCFFFLVGSVISSIRKSLKKELIKLPDKFKLFVWKMKGCIRNKKRFYIYLQNTPQAILVACGVFLSDAIFPVSSCLQFLWKFLSGFYKKIHQSSYEIRWLFPCRPDSNILLFHTVFSKQNFNSAETWHDLNHTLAINVKCWDDT